MKEFNLHIDLNEMLFDDENKEDVVSYLRKIADDIERGDVCGNIVDTIGHIVGKYLIKL